MSTNTSGPQNFFRQRRILLACLALFIILASIGFFSLRPGGVVAARVQATAAVEMPALSTAYVKKVIAREDATGSVQAHIQANATATAAIPEATATAKVLANPYPPHDGTIALSDSLNNNSSNDWYTFSDKGENCLFTGGAYHIKEPRQNIVLSCFATTTDFSNFVFQVQMGFVNGTGGGITFRANTAEGGYYYIFTIYTDGTYEFFSYSNQFSNLIRSNSSSAIKTGQNQTNMIAVKAQKNMLQFYVNNQLIDSVIDNSFNHGKIGLAAENLGNTTEVAFSNAMVWQLS
jgi:hypothetical protein